MAEAFVKEPSVDIVPNNKGGIGIGEPVCH